MNLFGTTHSVGTMLMASALRKKGFHGKNGFTYKKNVFLDECCLEDSFPLLTSPFLSICLQMSIQVKKKKKKTKPLDTNLLAQITAV